MVGLAGALGVDGRAAGDRDVVVGGGSGERGSWALDRGSGAGEGEAWTLVLRDRTVPHN
jgi:hypothetical protein